MCANREKNVAVAWHETDVFVPLSQAVLSRQARLAVLALDGIEVDLAQICVVLE